MSSIGILGQGTNIEANNTIIKNCGQYTIACNIGGTYNFTHCTFANYWNYEHRKNPSILLNNYYEGNNGEKYPRKLKEANFTNCIIYGGLSTEISFQESTAEEFNYFFDHCLIKIEDVNISSDNIHYKNNIINQDPQFININTGDLYLEENSPAIDMGKNTLINFDILQNQRNNPDIGAYEFTN